MENEEKQSSKNCEMLMTSLVIIYLMGFIVYVFASNISWL